ncbi:hypothetical protein [Vibrio cincinnatiensis]|uniref:hypothetical protein n=1 Tax=Vibrio cincinnatiensis TaxID=675 RepID=UPI001EE140D0|nr:hypothetical protein [Vibrio cincinnatiensis]MCG3736743.1 hypothetical protein [Vibrio cincinnatiensis]
MQKQIITSAIALTLFGCGGGESGNSGNPAPPVKNYTINFLGTGLQATVGNCQVFGYGPKKENGSRDKIIAYRTQPINTPTRQYEVFIHNADGSVRQHFRGSGLNTNQLQFAQREIPNDGYLSFVIFENFGTNVTTFAKSLLPDAFSVYTEGNITSCLTPNSANPREFEVKGRIQRVSGEPLSGFNTAYQNLDDITKFYLLNNPDIEPITFLSQDRPLLAINYETDSESKAIKSLLGFKFTPFTQTGTSGNPIKLDLLVHRNAPWESPTDINVENAFLFVNGKKQLPSANYAYLWQPFIQNGEVIHDKFSYTDSIGDNNYYLYLQGQQNVNGHPYYWGIQHVAQGTTNAGASLSADQVLDPLPQAETPILEACTLNESRQCLIVNTGELSANDGIQRTVLDAKLHASSSVSLRQVFYTPIQATLPILSFNKPNLDQGLTENTATTSVSLLISNSVEVREAFLYQHQNLQGGSENLFDPKVDIIPLLKNIAAQQDQQDLLKRQPYTWVWLEE